MQKFHRFLAFLCIATAFPATAGGPFIWGASSRAQNLASGGAISATTLILQNPSGSQPTLALSEDPDNGTNTVSLQAAATMGSDYTITLPDAVPGGNGYALTATTGGVASWTSVLTNPMDSTGDMIYGGAAGVATKLDNGTAGQWLVAAGAAAPTWTNTTTTGKIIDGSADEVQLTLQGNGTQTSNILLVEKSDGTDLVTINNNGKVAVTVPSGTNSSALTLSNDTASSPLMTATVGNGSGEGFILTGGSDNNSTKLFQILRSSTDIFQVRNNGVVFVSSASWGTGGTAIGVSSSLLTTSPSSQRYKKNIHEMQKLEVDSEKIYELRPVVFNYKIDNRKSFGYLAEEVVNIIPAIVHQEPGPDGVMRPESISYDHLTVLLVEEVKKLRAEIDELKKNPGRNP